MKTDIQIAQEAVLEPISDVAASLGLDGESLIPYGKYKAKVDHRLVKKLAEKKDAKVILVTAISPTPAARAKPPPAWAWRTRCTEWAKTSSSRCGSPASAPCSA